MWYGKVPFTYSNIFFRGRFQENVVPGVFKTFSSNFDVVLEVAAKVDNPNTASQTLLAESFVDKLIFKSGDISTMEARDVDLEYPTKDTFQTDTAISARLNGNSNKSEEKELEPWDPSSGLNGGSDNTPLELENANGWDANDMFRKNEQEYGVTSTFDQSLKGYTVPLRTVDSADYRLVNGTSHIVTRTIKRHYQVTKLVTTCMNVERKRILETQELMECRI